MPLVRMTALKDFRGTALSTTAFSTAYNLGGLPSTESLYGVLHLQSISTGRTFVGVIQSASSSGFAAPTTRITFALTSEIGATWATPVGGGSTDQVWWRSGWTLSTAVSTAGAWTGLFAMGRE